ncbi:MAG: glutathione S-transferase family protein [Gammaproteobacteria bacterium]|nr:glutathione S-transferase family protein [Gammaproteobacteria bacterium]MDH3748969.1 glutathione S-transferase family protein [Gammaproteobacteria bacterium]MDH3805500.1 glutathione S-transferase family protein [Gammaproteobacteria bacterium]
MKFYYHPISSYCQKVLVAMYEKGIEFEPHIVALMDPEARAQYRELYPMGKVPLLVVDDDHPIPESSTIIEYLDGIAEPKLVFGDADQRRKIRFKDRMFDLYLNESVSTLLFQSMKPESERDQERIDTSKFRIDTMYGFMEQELGEQPFSNGEEFSMSDCAATPALFYAQRSAPFNSYENISAYWDRLASRPSIRRVMSEAEPHLKAFMKEDAAA